VTKLVQLVPNDPGVLYAPLFIFVVLSILLAIRYSRPHIRCRRLPKADGEHRFHLKSFMSIDVPGRLSLVITSDRPVSAVRISAGPWVQRLEKTGEAFSIAFDGFPADGLAGIAVSAPEAADVQLAIAPSSEVRPRGFRSEDVYTFETEKVSSIARWALGVLVAFALYWGRFAFLPRTAWGPLLVHHARVWDMMSLGAIIVVSALAYRVCVRWRDQQSIEGSIDWTSPSATWPNPLTKSQAH
jgi:hypothetical protein